MALLTLQEAARQLNVTEQWLFRSTAPRRRMSRKLVRFDQAELDLWSRGQCRHCRRRGEIKDLIDGLCAGCREDL